MVDNKADIAVHSLKDLEWKQTNSLEIGAILKRSSRKDVLIGKWNSIYDLPRNAILGTASVRRKAFILSKRPDFQIHFAPGAGEYHNGKN
mgnify:CR=1 FL=1